jgi:hypothetical protein
MSVYALVEVVGGDSSMLRDRIAPVSTFLPPPLPVFVQPRGRCAVR